MSFCVILGGVPIKKPQVFHELIAVDVEIPREASDIHGITTEYAREHGRPAKDVIDEACDTLAQWHRNYGPIVGMNICYDLTMLDRECRRLGLPRLDQRLGKRPGCPPIGPVIDIYVLDKHIDRYRKGKRKLTDLAKNWDINAGTAHDAEGDVLSTLRIAWAMGRRSHMEPEALRVIYRDRATQRYGRGPTEQDRIIDNLMGIRHTPIGLLHELQGRWYAEQGAGLAAYLRREAVEREKLAALALDAEAAADRDGRRETAVEHSATAAALQEEAADLRRRADQVGREWPVIPYTTPTEQETLI